VIEVLSAEFGGVVEFWQGDWEWSRQEAGGEGGGRGGVRACRRGVWRMTVQAMARC
jgi:hypothetical protein